MRIPSFHSGALALTMLYASTHAIYDVMTRKFLVEPGAFDSMIGSASDDIRLRARLTVK